MLIDGFMLSASWGNCYHLFLVCLTRHKSVSYTLKLKVARTIHFSTQSPCSPPFVSRSSRSPSDPWPLCHHHINPSLWRNFWVIPTTLWWCFAARLSYQPPNVAVGQADILGFTSKGLFGTWWNLARISQESDHIWSISQKEKTQKQKVSHVPNKP
jgi:hypothetical protein